MVVPLLSCFAFAGLMALLGWRAARVRKSKATLANLRATVTPGTSRAVTGRQVEVHMVASEKPGEGRALLEAVAAEAERNGWALTLDAANDRLADYYRQLGFEPVGPSTQMPYGERVTRMVRL
jgi:hypothetical protein